jgi:hypothetical protein
MKTTVDLPIEVVRGLKLLAAQRSGKLKDITMDCLALSLSTPSHPAGPRKRFRVKLPIIPAPVGSLPFEIDGQRAHELEMESESESYEASLRR